VVVGRPDGACVIHPPPRNDQPWERADRGYLTCWGCYKRVRSWLVPYTRDRDGRPASIPGLYAILSAVPGLHPVAGDSGLRTPAFGPRSPANDTVIAMTDHRSTRNHRWPAGDPHSVPGVLAEWVAQLAVSKNLTGPPPRSVLAMCQVLDRNLGYITRQAWVVEFAIELGWLRRQLVEVNQPRKVIGRCPNTIDEGLTTRRCGAMLFAPVYGDHIECWAPDCRREWARREWFKLGGLIAP
jgi:hypothetical protein